MADKEALGTATNGLPIYPGDYIVDVTLPVVGGTVKDMIQLKGSSEPFVRITRKTGEETIIPVAEALKIPQTDEEFADAKIKMRVPEGSARTSDSCY